MGAFFDTIVFVMTRKTIFNKGFLQNFAAITIAVLLIVAASIINLSRPEPVYATSCSMFDGTDQSTCETGHTGCLWNADCSVHNGNEATCRSTNGCDYPANIGDCSAFGDSGSCTSNSCTPNESYCSWDGMTCTGNDSCSGYGSEEWCNSSTYFVSCSGSYDTGACTGTMTSGVCNGDFDNTAPILSIETPVSTPTNDATPSYIFTTDEAGTIGFSGCDAIPTGSLSAGSNLMTINALTEGTYSNCLIWVTDAANNQSSNLNIPEFVIDLTAPTTSGAPDMTDATDSGSSNSDNITSDTTPTFTGVCTNGNTVQLFVNSDPSGNSAVCSGGTFALTAADTFFDGARSVVFKETDTAGNVSSASTELVVTVDTTAPTVSLTAPTDGATVSGASVTVSADASDTNTIVGVQFKRNTSTNIGSEDTTSTYGVTWDTTALSNGSQTLIAVARDTAGNYATSTDITVTVNNDTTAPIISAVASSTSATTSLITWTTDEAATSTLNFGLTTSYGTATSSQSATTSHTYTLTGLTPATLYHYQVASTDASGNRATSSDKTFTTLALSIPTVTISSATSVGTSSVTLNGTITSDGNASSTARGFAYGITSSYGATSTTSGTFGVGAYSASLTSLTCNTTYHMQAFAVNSQGTGTSSDSTFTTGACPDTTAPTISSVSSGTPTTSGTTVTWTTDEDATSTISYGLTTSYGTVATSSGATSHSATLTGLTANTLYHYQITALDATLNTATTSDATFTTAAEASSDPAPSSSSNAGPTSGGGGAVSFYQAPSLFSNTVIPLNVASSSGSSGGGVGISSNGPTSKPVNGPTLAQQKQTFTNPNGTTFTFNKNLTPYTTIATDAKKLQIFLNAVGFPVTKVGAGSPGKENTRFGPATRAALARFQKAVGITPAIGTFGPITRAYINKLLQTIVGKK